MRAEKRIKVLVTVFVGLVTYGQANAQIEAEPQGLKMAPGVRLYPEIGVHYIRDSNFFYRPDGQEEEVSGTLARAGFSIVDQGERARFEIGANAEGADFDNGDEDDYVDSRIYGEVDYGRLGRHRFRARLERADAHDPFGRRRTENSPLENRDLDEYHENKGQLSYRFGNPSAAINLQYQLFYFEKEYDTNREEGTRFLDFERLEHQGSLYYNYSAKTSALFRVSHRDIDYPQIVPGFPTRDAEEVEALVGVEWLASAKTNGRFLVGAFKRDRAAEGFDDFTGVDWDVMVDWAPREVTVFTLTAGRDAEESFLVNASFMDTKKGGLTWRQQWSQRFSSTLGGQYIERDFEDQGRRDEWILGRLELEFALSRQLFLVGEARYQDRDSTEPDRIFDKHVYTIGFRFTP